MIIELGHSTDWWEFWAFQASLDADTVALEWSWCQAFQAVGPPSAKCLCWIPPVIPARRHGPGEPTQGPAIPGKTPAECGSDAGFGDLTGTPAPTGETGARMLRALGTHSRPSNPLQGTS